MIQNFKLRLAAWIVDLWIFKWAQRVEGERLRRELYVIFDALDDYEAICDEERNGAATKK